MKSKTMVHPYHARTVESAAEQERLLQQGWVFTAVKPKTKQAKRMRTLRQQRLVAGWYRADFMLEPWQILLVNSVRMPGETFAELVTRLAEEHCLRSEKPKVHGHK